MPSQQVSGSSEEKSLRDTAIRLISHHQSLEGILQEVSSLEGVAGKDQWLQDITDLSSYPVLETEAYLSSSPIGQYGTSTCASKFISIAKSCQGQLLMETQKKEACAAVQLLKRVQMSGKLNLSHFHRVVCCPVTSLPVHLLMILHKEGVFSVEKFIALRHAKKMLLPGFVDQLKEMCEEENSVPCLADVLCELITLGYQCTDSAGAEIGRRTGTEAAEVGKLAAGVLDQLVLDMIDKVVKCPDQVCRIVTAFSRVCLDPASTQSFYRHTLTIVTSHRPVMKVSQAVRAQDQWAYGKISDSLVEFYKQILMQFDQASILEMLRTILEEQEVNWQLLLSFVSVMTVCIPESSKAFLDFTDSQLRDGLEECDLEMTVVGLLLARQACFQGPHVFISYPDWFQRTFSEASRSFANSRKSFSFFIKLLTDLAPYESAHHLKAHILRQPYVPAKCRQLLQDYVALAKTRLEDLKETVEAQDKGQAGGSTSDNKLKEGARNDMTSAVLAFQTTGEVPISIIQASLFRQPYYMGYILPELLTPRHLPDKPDCKMRLIAALKQMDKIPEVMFSKYTKACQREAQQLLEGVFIDSDSDDEMELPPLELLRSSLRQLPSVVTPSDGPGKQKPKYTVAELLSLICQRLEGVLSVSRTDRQHESSPRVVLIGVKDERVPAIHEQIIMVLDSVRDSLHVVSTNPQLSQLSWLLQVVDIVVDMVLDSVRGSLHVTSTSHDVTSVNHQFTWLPQLLQAIVQYPRFTESLTRRIYDILTKKGASVDNQMMDCIGALLVEIQLLGDQFPWIGLPGLPCATLLPGLPCATLTETVMDGLSCCCRDGMRVSLRLMCAYLRYLLIARTEMVDIAAGVSLVQKFTYLSQRLYARLRYTDLDPNMTLTLEASGTVEDVAAAVYLSEGFQSLKRKIPLTLSDWVRLELAVSPGKDHLTDFKRHEYYTWAVYQHFLQQSRPDQERDPGHDAAGRVGSYRQVAATIMKEMLVGNSRCVATSVDPDRMPSYSSSGLGPHWFQKPKRQRSSRIKTVKNNCRNRDVQNTCPMCNRSPGDISTNRVQLVNLLQELTHMFKFSETSSDHQLPWLPQVLSDVVQRSTDGIQRQTVVQQFYRLALCLPAHLMFYDYAHHLAPTNSERWFPVLGVINSIMVEYLTEGLYLPASITAHLTQGLLMAVETESVVGDVIDIVCERCPVLMISILVHFETVHPFLLPLLHCESSQTCRALKSYSQKKLDGGLDVWLLAAVLFAQLVCRPDESEMFCLSEAIDRIPDGDGDHVQLRCCLSEMIVLQLSYIQELTISKRSCERLEWALLGSLSHRHGAAVLGHLLTDQVVEVKSAMCVSKALMELKCLTTLRFLRDNQDVVTPGIKFSVTTVSGLLRCYTSIGALYEQQAGRMSADQSVGVPDLQSIVAFVAGIIRVVPSSVRRHLDQDLVMSCGPRIRDLVMKI